MENNSSKQNLFAEFPAVSTDAWMAAVEKDLKGGDFEKRLVWKTYEGLALRPFYREEDLIGLDWLQSSLPGEAPYVRGAKRADNLWEVRQDILNADLKEANTQALRALDRGANGIALTTQVVNGKVRGQNIQSQADLATVLKGVWIDAAPVHFDWGMQSPVALKLYTAYAASQGVASSALQGSFGFDPLADLAQGGSVGLSADSIKSAAAQMIKDVQTTAPGMRAITVQAHVYHNAGAQIAQEIAYALAAGVEYISAAVNAGISAVDAVKSIGFSFSVGSLYFLEIAKFRVFRLLWSAVLEQFGVNEGMSHIHAQTSKWSMTVFDPNVNMLRGTTQAMSATIAGVDALTVLPYDCAFREPNEFSYRISRNVQLLLMHEAGFDKIVDPSAGSWYIEKITEGLAEQAWKIFQGVEAQGGLLAALQAGTVQEAIAKVKASRAKNISARKDVFLGTNSYPNLLENMAAEIKAPVENALKADSVLTTQVATDAICVKALQAYRGAELFEQIRLATERFVLAGNKKPTVYLWTQGSLAMRKARATFAQNFFGCAGYEVIEGPGFNTVAEGVEVVSKLNPEVVVLCSSDDEYAALVPEICQALQTKAVKILAGAPGDKEADYKAAGIADFIHMRTNAADFLSAFQVQLGVQA